uniref:Protein kinase domain-containing protein n=2 Tax=Caenorhabditis japonica TaxID=281687 RepID=A0A8R1DM98_CAEJA
MSGEEEEEDVNFRQGNEITSSKAAYTVSRLLGEGGFGAVYLVKNEKTNKSYAMKVEKKVASRKHSKLKMEIAILKAVSGKHFTKIVDRGKKDKEQYFFLVMELVGKSLADLKSDMEQKCFSFQTGMGAGLQCLEAVEDLHKAGFIHRDLKPQNYACGLEDKKHMVYILDFGIARKFTNAKNELKTPRETVGFK